MQTTNIFKTVFFVITSLVITACTDKFFDVEPKDNLTNKSFWNTEKHAEMGLAGCYNEFGYNGVNILWQDMIGGNGFSQYSWDGVKDLGNGTLNAGSSQINLFQYNLTTRCNTFLAEIDRIQMDSAKKECFKGEVRFLRAYDYLRRVMYYGDCPLVTEPIISPSDAQLSRDSQDKIMQFIVDELTSISENGALPVENDIESGGHVTRGAAYALKARTLLYMGKYSEAMATAQKVIKMPCYELFPDYNGIFFPSTKSSNKETIFALQYIRDFFPEEIQWAIKSAKDGGSSSVTVAKNLVDAYECANGLPITNPASGYSEEKQFENRDPRLAKTVVYPGQYLFNRIFNTLDEKIDGDDNSDYWGSPNAPVSGLSLRKYLRDVPTSDLDNGDSNVPVIRLAEVYLTYAEAAEKVGNGVQRDSALMLINMIRSRSGHIVATSLTEDLVRRERRVELAFEGLWYFDVKRWDLGATELGQPLYGTAYGSVNNTTGEITWAKKDGKLNYKKLEDRKFLPQRKYLLMIPQAEIDANPNMIQNPGY